MTDALRSVLEELIGGKLPAGMQDTPKRVARAWREMTRGYLEDPATILSRTFDAGGYDQVVMLRSVPFQSLCEHHLLPFTGTVDLAYLPGKRVVGLSKLARLVDCYARRFQIQERMTKDIADAMERHLRARGVIVIVSGVHSCMTTRGVLKPGAAMTTSDVRGVFRRDAPARAEALSLLGFRAV
jgi:GTP cyclohydrolase I